LYIYLIDIQTTPYAILGLLAIEPMSGYDIRREIEESLSFFWSESYGQIYPALKRLETARLIAPAAQARSGMRRRRVFRITALGEAKLRAWLAEPPVPQPPRNELLLKIFFGRHAPPGACAAHVRRLRIQQQQLSATLTRVTRQLRAERPGDPNLRFWFIVVSAGLSRADALIQWSDQALSALAGGS